MGVHQVDERKKSRNEGLRVGVFLGEGETRGRGR